MHHLKIIELLLDTIKDIPDHKIQSITCGAHIAGVESLNMGLATWAWGGREPVPFEKLPAPETYTSAGELAQLIQDNNPLNASLGMAALNSLLPEPARESLEPINAKDLILSLGKGKKVAIIGHFPFVKQLKNQFEDLMVFEKKPQPGDISADLIPEKMPRADLVALTATTIANKTLGGILDHCSKNAVKIIIGPSTPLTPALFDLGFSFIAGSLVRNREIARQGIKADISFKQLKGVDHVIMTRDKNF
ncbi:MAG: DUF364 domain-containing protein [Desulfobacteraceae bacterium]